MSNKNDDKRYEKDIFISPTASFGRSSIDILQG